MGSKILRPDILPLLFVVILCLSVSLLILLFDPPSSCRQEVLLCGFYNTSLNGSTDFNPGCVRVCNDSDNISLMLFGYGSGSNTFIRK
jgi:hypothetical protein